MAPVTRSRAKQGLQQEDKKKLNAGIKKRRKIPTSKLRIIEKKEDAPTEVAASILQTELSSKTLVSDEPKSKINYDQIQIIEDTKVPVIKIKRDPNIETYVEKYIITNSASVIFKRVAVPNNKTERTLRSGRKLVTNEVNDKTSSSSSRLVIPQENGKTTDDKTNVLKNQMNDQTETNKIVDKFDFNSNVDESTNEKDEEMEKLIEKLAKQKKIKLVNGLKKKSKAITKKVTTKVRPKIQYKSPEHLKSDVALIRKQIDNTTRLNTLRANFKIKKQKAIESKENNVCNPNQSVKFTDQPIPIKHSTPLTVTNEITKSNKLPTVNHSTSFDPVMHSTILDRCEKMIEMNLEIERELPWRSPSSSIPRALYFDLASDKTPSYSSDFIGGTADSVEGPLPKKHVYIPSSLNDSNIENIRPVNRKFVSPKQIRRPNPRSPLKVLPLHIDDTPTDINTKKQTYKPNNQQNKQIQTTSSPSEFFGFDVEPPEIEKLIKINVTINPRLVKERLKARLDNISEGMSSATKSSSEHKTKTRARNKLHQSKLTNVREKDINQKKENIVTESVPDVRKNDTCSPLLFTDIIPNIKRNYSRKDMKRHLENLKSELEKSDHPKEPKVESIVPIIKKSPVKECGANKATKHRMEENEQKKLDEELNKYAEEFNKTCEEIETYELIVE